METTTKSIKVKDKFFEPYISSQEIDKAIQNIAQQINVDFAEKDPLFLVILNGAFMFAADLMKYVNIPSQLSFTKLSSYSGTQSTQVIKELIGLEKSLEGRSVIIIEDIVDSGMTMNHLLKKLEEMGVKEAHIATLVFKKEAFLYDFPLKYVGINIPNKFIVGYGLDYDGYGRNLADIYKIIE